MVHEVPRPRPLVRWSGLLGFQTKEPLAWTSSPRPVFGANTPWGCQKWCVSWRSHRHPEIHSGAPRWSWVSNSRGSCQAPSDTKIIKIQKKKKYKNQNTRGLIHNYTRFCANHQSSISANIIRWKKIINLNQPGIRYVAKISLTISLISISGGNKGRLDSISLTRKSQRSCQGTAPKKIHLQWKLDLKIQELPNDLCFDEFQGAPKFHQFSPKSHPFHLLGPSTELPQIQKTGQGVHDFRMAIRFLAHVQAGHAQTEGADPADQVHQPWNHGGEEVFYAKKIGESINIDHSNIQDRPTETCWHIEQSKLPDVVPAYHWPWSHRHFPPRKHTWVGHVALMISRIGKNHLQTLWSFWYMFTYFQIQLSFNKTLIMTPW